CGPVARETTARWRSGGDRHAPQGCAPPRSAVDTDRPGRHQDRLGLADLECLARARRDRSAGQLLVRAPARTLTTPPPSPHREIGDTAMPDETIRLTADVVAIAPDADGLEHVLLIRRRWAPYEGHWALPGGHV